MSLMDKIRSFFSGGATGADSHAGDDHSSHDHSGHDHSHEPTPAEPAEPEADDKPES